MRGDRTKILHPPTAVELKKRLPNLRWHEPANLLLDGKIRYGCRLCIALIGIKGKSLDELPYVFKTLAACQDHIRKEHQTKHDG